MATAVPAASLPLPRRASSSASAARRSGPPPLRKRHCAARPVSAAYSTPPPRQLDNDEDCSGRRQVLVAGAAAVPAFLSRPNPAALAAEAKKGFLPVTDKKAGYSFLYPFAWQEVAVQGQDKVYKDVIEPLESVRSRLFPPPSRTSVGWVLRIRLPRL